MPATKLPVPTGTRGHVGITDDGRAYAVWTTPTIAARYAGGRHKLNAVRRMTEGLAQINAQNWSLFGIMRQESVGELADRMCKYVIETEEEATHRPTYANTVKGWMEYVEYAEQLSGNAPRRRENLLVIELPASNSAFKRAAYAAWVGIARSFLKTPPPPPDVDALEEAMEQAAVIEESLGKLLDLSRASAGEQRYYIARLRDRGLEEVTFDEEEFAPYEGEDVWLGSAGECVINAKKDREKGAAMQYMTVRSERLMTDLETGEETMEEVVSFQSFAVITDLPVRWHKESGGLMGILEGLEFPVDVALLGTSIPNQKARATLRRRRKTLAFNAKESEGDVTGPEYESYESAALLDEEEVALAQTRGPRLPVCIVVGIGADSLAELRRHWRVLKSQLDPSNMRTTRPIGEQTILYNSFMLGAARPSVATQYERYLHADGIAALGFQFAEQAGSPYGPIRGYVMTGNDGPPSYFLDAPSYGLGSDEGNKSVVRMFRAEQGSGKSTTIKGLWHDNAASGGQTLALDITEDAEYVRGSAVMPAETTTVVFNPQTSDTCIDPLQMFTNPVQVNEKARKRQLKEAETHTIGYYAIKCGLKGGVKDEEYVQLSTAVQTVLADSDPTRINSRRLLEVLEERSGVKRTSGIITDLRKTLAVREEHLDEIEIENRHTNARLAQRIRTISRAGSTSEAIFGTGPLLDLNTDSIVFHCPDLNLPSESQLQSGQMLPEQTDALALLYLIAAIMKYAIFRSRRYSMAIFDEIWFLADANNPAGQELLYELILNLRKHIGGAIFGGQIDLGTNERAMKLNKQIRLRHLGRQDDPDEAREGLIWVGAEPSEENIALVQALEAGQFFVRDQLSRVTLVQMLEHPDPNVAAAFKTSRSRAEQDQRGKDLELVGVEA